MKERQITVYSILVHHPLALGLSICHLCGFGSVLTQVILVDITQILCQKKSCDLQDGVTQIIYDSKSAKSGWGKN
jgi:hypothetical protein